MNAETLNNSGEQKAYVPADDLVEKIAKLKEELGEASTRLLPSLFMLNFETKDALMRIDDEKDAEILLSAFEDVHEQLEVLVAAYEKSQNELETSKGETEDMVLEIRTSIADYMDVINQSTM